MQIDIVAPAEGTVGEEVSITVTISDADAAIGECLLFFGDEQVRLIPPLKLLPRFGAWTPPDKERGYRRLTFKHTYSEAGTFHGQIWADSGNLSGNPYGDEGSKSFTITVVAANATPSPGETGNDNRAPSPEPKVEPTSTGISR